MLNPVFQKRFQELDEAFQKFKPHQNRGLHGDLIDSWSYTTADWKPWAISAESLIRVVYGESAPHCVHFCSASSKVHGQDYAVKALYGQFKAAKEDF